VWCCVVWCGVVWCVCVVCGVWCVVCGGKSDVVLVESEDLDFATKAEEFIQELDGGQRRYVADAYGSIAFLLCDVL